ncbi:hypothetical protein ON010_g18637 [Phytophthora cinnamomi]|nr:hypothetical protein ON010_g18637 [Phytophthora cinnamomi]
MLANAYKIYDKPAPGMMPRHYTNQADLSEPVHALVGVRFKLAAVPSPFQRPAGMEWTPADSLSPTTMVFLSRVAVLFTAALAAAATLAQTTQQKDTASLLQAFEDCMDKSAANSSSNDNGTLTENTNFFVSESPLYEDYATGPKARIDRKPLGVYFATSEEDVVRAVKCSVNNGLAPVPRSGGHSYEVLSSMDGSLVIDIADMVDVNLPGSTRN